MTRPKKFYGPCKYCAGMVISEDITQKYCCTQCEEDDKKMSDKKVLLVEIERAVAPVMFIHSLRSADVADWVNGYTHSYCNTKLIGRVIQYKDDVISFQADSMLNPDHLKMISDYMKSLNKAED